MVFSMQTSPITPPFEKPWGNYLLDKIVENQAPETISWLPQTLGWKLLTIALLILAIRKGYRAYKHYQQNAYRREALAWLNQCQQSNDVKAYQQLPALLRKTALCAFSRTDISQLSGDEWEHWLDQQCQQSNFTTSCPKLLHQLAYMPIDSLSFKAEHYQVLITQMTLWINHHRSQYDEL